MRRMVLFKRGDSALHSMLGADKRKPELPGAVEVLRRSVATAHVASAVGVIVGNCDRHVATLNGRT